MAKRTNQNFWRSFSALGILAATPALAATASLNGANIPTLPQLVDAQSHVWTVSSGIVYEDGKKAGFTSEVATLLYYGGGIYQINTGGSFYKWNGTSWDRTLDPRVISTNGANVPATSTIIDTQKHIWSFGPIGGAVYRDGAKDAASVNVSMLLDYYGVVYQENSAHVWHSWNGSSWVEAAKDPRTTPVKMISAYANCDGKTDSQAGVVAALTAVANDQANLIVDCPVFIHVGTDIKKPVYIDNGTNVIFTGAGKFSIDNMFLPGFVIANSGNINFTNWNVEWDNVTPVSGDPGGYYINGKFIDSPGKNNAQGEFNTSVGIAGWLSANRGIVFNKVNSVWNGGAPPMAVFYFIGDDSNISFSGMHLGVPATAGGDAFIPVAFTFVKNFKNNQSVTSSTPMTSQYVQVPRNLTFSDITLDGTLMGFLGNVQNATFENIVSNRYGDLQDAQGGTVGGVAKWFPPPHLFYINFYEGGDPNLYNNNIVVENVTDNGIRVGTARDNGVSLPLQSGYANSLKIGGENVTVNNYVTNRPDGFMDVYQVVGAGMKVSNVKATYNSQFTHGYFPGWRFPASPYKNLTFTNVSLTDLAPVTAMAPVVGPRNTANSGITMNNVSIAINQWPNATTMEPASADTGAEGLLSPLTGSDVNADIQYTIASTGAATRQNIKSTATSALQAVPATMKLGKSVTLTWSSTNGATDCVASGVTHLSQGNWSGSVGTSGSRTVTVSMAETANFTLTCSSATDSAVSVLPVVVTP